MKDIKTYILEASDNKFHPVIPKNLYYDEELLGKDAIKKMKDEVEEINLNDIKLLFKGKENSKFKYIFWDGNSEGYDDAFEAINKLFPGEENIYGYLDNAEYYKDLDEDSNSFIAKFISKDNKMVCEISEGDLGYGHVFVEQ